MIFKRLESSGSEEVQQSYIYLTETQPILIAFFLLNLKPEITRRSIQKLVHKIQA